MRPSPEPTYVGCLTCSGRLTSRATPVIDNTGEFVGFRCAKCSFAAAEAAPLRSPQSREATDHPPGRSRSR